jgi:1,4-alpha-glucan branching enzyme
VTRWWAWLVVLFAGCAGSTAPSPVLDAALDAAAMESDAAPTPDASIAEAGPFDVGLGVTPYDGGVALRVWAPGADSVHVAGDFNGFSATATPLARDMEGVFGARIDGAQLGQELQYVVTTGTVSLALPDPRSRDMTSYRGRTIITDPASFAWQHDFLPAPTNQLVIYELHVGTFNPQLGRIGTFLDVIGKLDHLASLGVNMIELMPPAEFPGTNSWGYNPAVPFATATVYGSSADLKSLIDEAHARSIGVIVDVVHNHWISRPLNGYAGYFYTDPVKRMTPWGPRPDFSRPEVRDYIRDDTLMWALEYRADGLRWDSVLNIRSLNGGAPIPEGISLLQEINDRVHRLPKPFLQIAEDLHTVDYVTQTSGQGGDGFDTQWDAAFFHPIDDNIITPNDSDRVMGAIAGAVEHTYNGDPLQRVIYTEDHDEVANGKARIPQMISPMDPGSLVARKRSTLGAAVTLTSPGIPMLFMGQEFLEDGSFADTHPLDWSKTATYAGILTMYRDLIRLRRNVDGTTRGLSGSHVRVFHINDVAKVVAYQRWDVGGPADDVVVLANFSATRFNVYTIGLPRSGTWSVRFNSDAIRYSSDFGGAPSTDVSTRPAARDGMNDSGDVALGAYAVVILSQ